MELRFETVDGVLWNVARDDDGTETWAHTKRDGETLRTTSRKPPEEIAIGVSRFMASLSIEEQAQLVRQPAAV